MDGEMPNYLLAKDLILQVSLMKSQLFLPLKIQISLMLDNPDFS